MLSWECVRFVMSVAMGVVCVARLWQQRQTAPGLMCKVHVGYVLQAGSSNNSSWINGIATIEAVKAAASYRILRWAEQLTWAAWAWSSSCPSWDSDNYMYVECRIFLHAHPIVQSRYPAAVWYGSNWHLVNAFPRNLTASWNLTTFLPINTALKISPNGKGSVAIHIHTSALYTHTWCCHSCVRACVSISIDATLESLPHQMGRALK